MTAATPTSSYRGCAHQGLPLPHSPVSIKSTACPFPAASKASQSQGSFRETSYGLWPTSHRHPLRPFTTRKGSLTHCTHPSSSGSCVFTGSDNFIYTKPWMLSSVIGCVLEAGASSRTVQHRLGPHLRNNSDRMDRLRSTYLCVY